MKRYLLVTLGFTASNLEALHRALSKKGYSSRVRVIGRAYPEKSTVSEISFKQSDFDFVTDATFKSLFSDNGSTLFCNNEHETCALKFGRGKKSCLNSDENRCRDSRPDVVLLLYMSPATYKIGGRVGRYFLPVRCSPELFGKSERLSRFCVDIIDGVEKGQYWSAFIRKDTRRFLLLPHKNFQNQKRDRGVNSITSLEDFSAFIGSVDRLFDKKGNKVIDERDLEFKEDHLHRFPSANVAKRDWIDAHYRYGFRFDFRYHFDVTQKNDGYVRNVNFFDLFKGESRGYTGDHLNIFPNEEIQ